MRHSIIIWDPVVRVFHWTVAAAFLLNALILEEGSELHEWAGYYVLSMLVIRVVWGLIGTHNARFANFFPSKLAIRTHIQELISGHIPEDNGHNPLGAIMIFALLIGLALTGLSGWAIEGVFSGAHLAEEVHGFFANSTLVMVFMHVLAVVVFTLKGPRNLIAQMITGRVTRR